MNDRAKFDIESQIAIPLDDALTAARLFDAWFEHVARDRYPKENPFLALNDAERRTIRFCIGDLITRLVVLDERISGPGGISPR